ncbi:MAG: hypothetical protein AB3N63_08155 [Puniceicoccaceae bacterium]
MLRHLHRGGRRILLLLLSSLINLPAFADTETDPEESAWDALLRDVEATEALFSDPTYSDEDSEPISSFLYISTIAAGYGYSDNFLKRNYAVSSAYTRFEADLWFNWSRGNQSLTGLFFAELNLYEKEFSASDEYLAFGLLTWMHSMDKIQFGVDLQGMVADQIYDESLTTLSVPQGTNIYQANPEANLFIEWFPGSRDKLRLEVGAGRAEFDIDNEDFWEPGAAIEWEHLWRFSIKTKTKIGYSRQLYDDELIRDPRGNFLSSTQLLEVDTVSILQKIEWKPAFWDWFKLTLYAGATEVMDRYGTYEEMTRTWVSLSPSMKFKWFQWSLSGRWSKRDYEYRWAGYFNPYPSKQITRSISTEVVKPLPWNLEMTLRAEWRHNQAREVEDTYTESRGELILGWSY